MVSASQDLGDLEAPDPGRTRVVRVVEDAPLDRERVLLGAAFVAERAGDEPDRGVEDGHGSHLAPAQHEVPHRYLLGLEEE